MTGILLAFDSPGAAGKILEELCIAIERGRFRI